MIKVIFFKSSGKYCDEFSYNLRGQSSNQSDMQEIIPAIKECFKDIHKGMHMVILPDNSVEHGYPHLIPADMRND